MKVPTDLLRPADFSNLTFPERSFILQPTELIIDEKHIPKPEIRVSYDQFGRCVFAIEGELLPFGFEQAFDDVRLVDESFSDEADLLIVRLRLFGPSNGRIEFWPRRDPFTMSFGRVATSVEAVLVNGPDLSGATRVFESENYLTKLIKFPRAEDARKERGARKYERIPIGRFELIRKDGGEIESESAWHELAELVEFFTFVRGAFCGLSHVFGRDRDGEIAFAHLGTSPCDHFEVPLGWYDFRISRELGKMYRMFRSSLAPDDGSALRRAILFYRSSNVSQDSDIATAIITSYAALEMLVPHVLKTRAGWSNNLLDKRDIRFADKLRAAANCIGLDADLYEHAPLLAEHAKRRNHVDGFEMLALFRNKMVHADTKFSYQPFEPVEVWQLAQWLCEMFIFYLLGYRGEMADRRRYKGYRGHFSPVPLFK